MSQEATAHPVASAREQGQRKQVVGTVVSAKMAKTRTVTVTELQLHPLFKKYLRRTHKFHVHDERNESREGDTVQIISSRPLSATKRWRLLKVLNRPSVPAVTDPVQA